jgi:hypothetical protein
MRSTFSRIFFSFGCPKRDSRLGIWGSQRTHFSPVEAVYDWNVPLSIEKRSVSSVRNPAFHDGAAYRLQWYCSGDEETHQPNPPKPKFGREVP